MDSIKETQKRLPLIELVSSQVKDCSLAVILCGSMAWGQDIAVHGESDIDLVVVIKREDMKQLLKRPYFKNQVSEQVQRLFLTGEIDFFWVTRIMEGVEVNVFIYEDVTFTRFCLLEGNLKGFKKQVPTSIRERPGFNGKTIFVSSNVTSFGDGFLYEKKSLFNGRYISDTPRQSFLYTNKVLFEKDSYCSQLEPKIWNALALKLLEEGVDVNENSILESHFCYLKKKDKLPAKIIDKIKERTKIELAKHNFI